MGLKLGDQLGRQVPDVIFCPTGAATYAAYKQPVETGLISPEDTAVLCNCATDLKYEMAPSGGVRNRSIINP